jgi:hypothetical protein
VSWSLGSPELERLNLRAGYQRGRGYVHAVEAPWELLEEALQPYLDDIGRLAGLGLPAAAQEVAAGVLLGLYQYRDQPWEDTVMVEAPDFPVEAAGQVMDALERAGVNPPDGVEELLPDWSSLLHHGEPGLLASGTSDAGDVVCRAYPVGLLRDCPAVAGGVHRVAHRHRRE